MTASIQRRLAALETRDKPAFRVILRNDDETEERAKVREGVEPGEHVIVLPPDAWLVS
jgi:hypothetical protein